MRWSVLACSQRSLYCWVRAWNAWSSSNPAFIRWSMTSGLVFFIAKKTRPMGHAMHSGAKPGWKCDTGGASSARGASLRGASYCGGASYLHSDSGCGRGLALGRAAFLAAGFLGAGFLSAGFFAAGFLAGVFFVLAF